MAELLLKIDTLPCHGADSRNLLRPAIPVTLHSKIDQETATIVESTVACSYAKKVRNVDGTERVVCLAGLSIKAQVNAQADQLFKNMVDDIDFLAREENDEHYYREVGFKEICAKTLPCIQKYPL